MIWETEEICDGVYSQRHCKFEIDSDLGLNRLRVTRTYQSAPITVKTVGHSSYRNRMPFMFSACFAHINCLIPYICKEVRGYLSLLNKDGQI